MDDEKLILLVQEQECLYNKHCASFKDLNKRENAWRYIGDELEVPADVCMKRWTVLRDRYSKEARLCTKGEYMSTWNLYSAISFLRPHVKPRAGRLMKSFQQTERKPAKRSTTLKEELLEYDPLEELSDVLMPLSPEPCSENSYVVSAPESNDIPETPTSTRAKRENEDTVEKAFLEAVAYFKKVCKNKVSDIDPAVKAFGEMITATVNEMSASKQTRAIIAVTNLVMDIKESTE